MTTPFKALQPFEPRIVDIFYAAVTFPCVDCSDCSDTSETDVTDIETI